MKLLSAKVVFYSIYILDEDDFLPNEKKHFLSYKYDAAKVFCSHHCYGCYAFEVRFSRKQIWSGTMWLVTVVDELGLS